MKRTRLIAFALIISVMLMGAGYAAWSDTLNITTTASSGNMEVKFVEEQTSGAFYHYNQGYGYSYVGPMVNGTDYTVNDKTLVFDIDNMYPGLEMDFDFVMKNYSSIPVICDGATVTFENTDAILKDSIVLNYFVLDVYGENGYKETVLDWDDWLGSSSYYDDNKLTLAELEGFLQTNLVNQLRLEPGDQLILNADGDSADVDYWMWLPDTCENDTQDKSLMMYMTLSWKQFNQ